MFWNRRANPPEWPLGTGRPRIAVENVDAAEQWVAGRVLEDAGYHVVTCGGPDSLLGVSCPLSEGVDCPAVAEADAVVSSLRLENPAGREVISRLRDRHPGIPLIVEAPPAVVQAYGEVLEGCTIVYPLTADSLIEAVRDAAPQYAQAR